MSRREEILERPVRAMLLTLAWPVVLSNELVVLIGAITYFWMGRLGGTDGLAILAVMMPVATATSWLFGSVGAGAGSLVARSVGAKDGDGLRIGVSAIALTLAASVAVWVPGVALARPISAALVGDVPYLGEFSAYFVTWLLLALPTVAVAEVLLDTANASGWTKFGLSRVLFDLALIGGLMPVFMAVLDLGPKSAPLAAGSAAALLCALMGMMLFRHRERLAIGVRGRPLGRVIDWALWRRFIGIGLPPQIGRISTFLAQIVMVVLVSRAGPAAVAGYGLTFEVLFLVTMLTMGLAQANAIVVGQNLGANQPERCLESLKITMVIALATTGLALVGSRFARPLYELFIDDPLVVEHAMAALRIMSWGVVGLAVFQVLLATFTATGRTKLAGVLIVTTEAIGVVVALLLPRPAMESAAIAFCVANFLKAGVLLLLIPSAFLRALQEPHDED